jgi:hypothetical protein
MVGHVYLIGVQALESLNIDPYTHYLLELLSQVEIAYSNLLFLFSSDLVRYISLVVRYYTQALTAL